MGICCENLELVTDIFDAQERKFGRSLGPRVIFTNHLEVQGYLCLFACKVVSLGTSNGL